MRDPSRLRRVSSNGRVADQGHDGADAPPLHVLFSADPHRQVGLAAGATRRTKADLFEGLGETAFALHRKISKFVREKLQCPESAIIDYWASVTVRRPELPSERVHIFRRHQLPNGREGIEMTNQDVWARAGGESVGAEGDTLRGWGVWP